MATRPFCRISPLAALVLLAAACSDNPSSSGGGDDVDVTSDSGETDTVDDGAGGDTTDVVDTSDDADATGDTVESDGSGEPDGSGAEGCFDDQCAIDGECYDNATVNADNPCEICLVISSATEWTANDGASCDDDDVCTQDDACFAGACMGTIDLCDDGDPCTADLCDPATGECSTSPSTGGACSDLDACTVGEVCDSGTCGGGVARDCDDGNPCTADRCDPELGCVADLLDSVPCDDGDACTTGDLCAEGICIAGTAPLDCDDDSLCTVDRCIPELGCDYVSIADLCADDNPCTDEVCDPEQGCVYPFNDNSCSDGSVCTLGDSCVDGLCRGTLIELDDDNVCTADVCDPALGTSHVPVDGPCDDNDVCTRNDLCADGSCQAGTTPLDCDDGNICTDDDCDPVDGCQRTNNTIACSDDRGVCTINDRCGGGACSGVEISCDDFNDCTADSCDPVEGCLHELLIVDQCRPDILVDYPPRAATIQGGGNVISVTGSVGSGAGPITSLTLNGESVPLSLNAGTGRYEFSHPVTAAVGTNRLTFDAVDSFASTRHRVQAFHWSTQYTNPNPAIAGDGMVVPGIGMWLGQATIDDGVAPPPTDLAAIFQQVLAGFDINTFFDPNAVLASQAGYNIYLRSLNLGGTRVALAAIDGGLRIDASLLNITGRLYFDCTNFACQLLGGDGGGSLRITEIRVTANLMMSVRPDHTIQVSVVNPSTTISGLTVSADNGWTNFLLSLVQGIIRDSLVGDLEATLNETLAGQIGPLLEDALSALAFNLAFDLPRLDDATQTIPLALSSDFQAADFQDNNPGPQGGALLLRGRATTPVRGVPGGGPFDANLGTAMRVGCNLESQQLVLPRSYPIEVGLTDDILNQILRGAWWGGLFEFDVGPSLLGGLDLSSYGVVIDSLHISGLLPPHASDCTSPQLTLSAGDLMVTGQLQLLGQTVNIEVFVAFDAPIRLVAADGQVSIIIDAIGNVDLEVNVLQDDLIGLEPTFDSLLRSQLVPALGGLLGSGTPLAGFPLPEIDLSPSLGLPAGTAMIKILPESVVRSEGTSVISGRLQ